LEARHCEARRGKTFVEYDPVKNDRGHLPIRTFIDYLFWKTNSVDPQFAFFTNFTAIGRFGFDQATGALVEITMENDMVGMDE
jgi:hypothetical protein